MNFRYVTDGFRYYKFNDFRSACLWANDFDGVLCVTSGLTDEQKSSAIFVGDYHV